MKVWPISILVAVMTCTGWGQQTPAVGARNQPAGELLTLDEAVRAALDNNRPLKIAALEILKSEEEIVATRTRRLPSTSFNILGSQLLNEISFRFPQGQFGTFPGTGPIPARDTLLSTPRRPNVYVVAQVIQPLSQLHKINLGITQGEMERAVKQQQLRAQQHDVVKTVKQIYFAALETEGALAATQERLTFARELDRVVGNYVLEKVALKAEGLDVKAQVATLEYDTLALRNKRATLKEQLNQVMGRDLRTAYMLAEPAEPTALETDLAAAQNRALEQRPEIQEARLRLRQAEQDRRIKKAEYIPEISLSFHYISPFQIEFLPKNIAAVGLQVSWEPFDWGRRKHELAEKERTIEQVRQRVRDAEQGVLVDVNEKFRKLAEARALARVAEMSRDSAREKARVAQARYAERSVLLKDVVQAQSTLADAVHAHQQAVLAHWSARAEFEKALGEGR